MNWELQALQDKSKKKVEPRERVELERLFAKRSQKEFNTCWNRCNPDFHGGLMVG
jgi:hypothetical protein